MPKFGIRCRFLKKKKKKSIKKALLSTFEHYLHFYKQEWLKDWWKPEFSRTIAICLLWKAIFSSSSVTVWLWSITVVGPVKIKIGQCCNIHWHPWCFNTIIAGSMLCRLYVTPCTEDLQRVAARHWQVHMHDVMPYVQCMLNIMKICSMFDREYSPVTLH